MLARATCARVPALARASSTFDTLARSLAPTIESVARAARESPRHAGPRARAASAASAQNAERVRADAELAMNYPMRKQNTILNICERGKSMVVMRFGRFHTMHSEGYFWAIPFIDRIVEHDVREITLEIDPQATITKDNAHLDLSGVISLRVTDPEKATFSVQRPLYSAVQTARSALRNAGGGRTIDECLHSRSAISAEIVEALREPSEAWGIVVSRFEAREIEPSPEVSAAMSGQSIAERHRRQVEADAEATKKAAILQSEGVRIALTNEAEGNAARVRLAADADAHAVTAAAGAKAAALAAVGAALGKDGAQQASQIALASDYAHLVAASVQKGTATFFGHEIGDMPRFLATAASVARATLASPKPDA